MEKDKIHLRIPEYEHSGEKKGKNWIIGFITITISLTVALVIFENYLLALIIFLGLSILIFLSTRPPELIEFEVNKKGIRLAGSFYKFSSIRSFSLKKDEKKFVFLLNDRIMPLRVAHLGDTSEYEIEELGEFLKDYLAEEDLEEPLTHKIADMLGF